MRDGNAQNVCPDEVTVNGAGSHCGELVRQAGRVRDLSVKQVLEATERAIA